MASAYTQNENDESSSNINELNMLVDKMTISNKDKPMLTHKGFTYRKRYDCLKSITWCCRVYDRKMSS
jgi:hypothetical protein